MTPAAAFDRATTARLRGVPVAVLLEECHARGRADLVPEVLAAADLLPAEPDGSPLSLPRAAVCPAAAALPSLPLGAPVDDFDDIICGDSDGRDFDEPEESPEHEDASCPHCGSGGHTARGCGEVGGG